VRGKERDRQWGRCLRDAPASVPGRAAGTAVARGRGMTVPLHWPVRASQHMGGLDRVMRHHGMGHTQRQTRHQQTRQGQGEEPVSQEKGSTYHRWAT
jgi:hypothetical protein